MSRTAIRAGVVCLTAGFVAAIAPAVAQTPLSVAFKEICLDTLPGFVNAPEVLQAMGYELFPYGGNEFEFSSSESGLHGAVAVAEAGGVAPGCSVMDETSSMSRAMDDGAALLERLFGVTPDLWTYNGEPSGWTVPYEGRVLYVLFSGGGNSGEDAGGGLSAEIRDQ